ncbi:phosphoglycolate phosphatase [Caenispirillum salinarum]|uniref:phosphoglycolate phosphatase n=1 Tax=Caenispirillum salinarum TaxID=859058 RepID=UPI00384E59C9
MPSTSSPTASGAPLALIFDLDGTLVHSVPDLTAALNHLLAEHDRPAVAEDDVAFMVGDGARVLVQRAWAQTGAAAAEGDLDGLTERFVAIYETATAGATQPYPGVVATLETLMARGHPLAICTNKPHGATLKLLEELDLARFFTAVVGGGSTAERKPQAGPVLAVLDELGVPARGALFIGDSRNDVHAAAAAGVPCACVTYGYPRGPVEALGADRLIDHFDQVLDLMDAGADMDLQKKV